MQIARTIHLIAALIAATQLHGQLQTGAEPSRTPSPAILNIGKLETTITTDHLVYGPGEVIKFTISVGNPTSQPLQIPNPFWSLGVGIDLLETGTERSAVYGTEFTFASPHPNSSGAPLDKDLVLMQPSETMTRTIRSDEPTRPGGGPVIYLPIKSGRYRVVYSLAPSKYASFTIAQPILERFTTVKLPASGSSGSGAPGSHRMNAFVLAFGEQRLLMRTTDSGIVAHGPLRIHVGEPLSFRDATAISPYERVAELDRPVAALDLVPSSSGDIWLRWQDASGRKGEHEIQLPPPAAPSH